MGKVVEPKVFLIGESQVNREGLQDFLDHMGVSEWTSDAPTDAELLTEVYGRSCYKSFGTELNPNITRVRHRISVPLTPAITFGSPGYRPIT